MKLSRSLTRPQQWRLVPLFARSMVVYEIACVTFAFLTGSEDYRG